MNSQAVGNHTSTLTNDRTSVDTQIKQGLIKYLREKTEIKDADKMNILEVKAEQNNNLITIITTSGIVIKDENAKRTNCKLIQHQSLQGVHMPAIMYQIETSSLNNILKYNSHNNSNVYLIVLLIICIVWISVSAILLMKSTTRVF